MFSITFAENHKWKWGRYCAQWYSCLPRSLGWFWVSSATSQALTTESSLELKPWMHILEGSPVCLDSRCPLIWCLCSPLDSDGNSEVGTEKTMHLQSWCDWRTIVQVIKKILWLGEPSKRIFGKSWAFGPSSGPPPPPRKLGRPKKKKKINVYFAF